MQIYLKKRNIFPISSKVLRNRCYYMYLLVSIDSKSKAGILFFINKHIDI